MLREVHLVKSVRCDLLQAQLGPHAVVKVSTEIMSHVGSLKKGDFALVLVQNTASTSLVRLEVFLEVLLPLDPEAKFLFVGFACASVRAKLWGQPAFKITSPLSSIARRQVVRIDAETNRIQTTM